MIVCRGIWHPSQQWRLWLVWCAVLSVCWANNKTNPMSIFLTRPDLQTPIFTIDEMEPESLTPGYFFFGVYEAAQNAPLIYDTVGNLVWNGFGAAGPGIAHAIHVCNYKGAPHLCYYNGEQMLGYGKGHGVIMDNSYNIVKTVEPAGSSMTVDMHEFNLIHEGRSALITIYHPHAYDLGSYGITDGMGWVQESRFQEVDVETGKMIFEWRSLDHVDPEESFVRLDATQISGDGSTKDTPWDYFHINSVDKNADGDYLVSGRHVSTVFKISGKDGSIIWRLGGSKSDFQFHDFTFSSQHDARWLSENSTHTVISIFDNAFNGYNQTYPESRGMIIALDHSTKEAQLIQDYKHPQNNLIDCQGNTQIMANGNVVQGWGSRSYITEHLPDGRTIFSGWLATERMMIYRVYKANWTAEPHWDPSVFSYSKENMDTVFYASWNGATEVTHWRFYGSASRSGPFKLIHTAEKAGFETVCQAPQYSAYVYAEALCGDKVLRVSPVEKTFTPGPLIRSSCDDFTCPVATRYWDWKKYDNSVSKEAERKLKAEAKAKAKAEAKAKAKAEAEAEEEDDDEDLDAWELAVLQLGAVSFLITGLFLLNHRIKAVRIFNVATTAAAFCRGRVRRWLHLADYDPLDLEHQPWRYA